MTSRAALGLREEWQFPVPPLLLPDLSHLPPTEALADYPAIALFVERAQAVNPNLALTAANAAIVAAICAHLDGLPLAIELAAAWSKALSPQELLARLDNRLALLTGSPLHHLPTRHRTLRAAIAWSYDLIGPGEQTLLARLAVFAGGCTLAVAEEVCAEKDEVRRIKAEIHPSALILNPSQVLEGLASLVNKSLLLQQEQTDGQSRFMMLKTIQEYALEKLAERGEWETMRQRHAAYYMALAEAAEPELRGPQQQLWLARLENEHNNMRAALN